MITVNEQRYQITTTNSVNQISVIDTPIQLVEVSPVILELSVDLKHENLIGEINGINKTFTSPTKFTTAMIFKNGLLLQKNEDYIEVDDQIIEFIDAPLNVGFIDKLQIIYRDK